MQITPTTLNIPPYISTSWDLIAYLKTENKNLIIILKNDEHISIPNLDDDSLQQIFEAHATYLEKKDILPLNLNGLSSIATIHHNPDESQLPDLPSEILEKIALVTKTLGGDEASLITPADSTCNCTFCQIARALQTSNTIEEEKIDDADLTFRDWGIEQIDTKLYCVTSPLDPNEQYKVFLGDPIGCNCGQNHCEHIEAVLKS
jgi:hypothetical protein